MHVTIDDATRLGYAEILPDEKKITIVDFLARAVGSFSQHGITYPRALSDNSCANRS